MNLNKSAKQFNSKRRGFNEEKIGSEPTIGYTSNLGSSFNEAIRVNKVTYGRIPKRQKTTYKMSIFKKNTEAMNRVFNFSNPKNEIRDNPF